MKKTYIKPAIELTIVSTECNLLAASETFETKAASYESSNVTDLSKGHTFDIWGDAEDYD